jgi:voltage-gated potassium channel
MTVTRKRLSRRLREFVSAYPILIALTILCSSWGVISVLVYRAERGVEGANIGTLGDAAWWGIVTFLTVGYGDKYPVTTDGRVYAGILMLAGVLAVAIITSKISSYFLEQALREGRGQVNTGRLKDHFIVCGWKEDLHALLEHMLDFNPGIEASQIVLVANIKPNQIEALLEHPRLSKLQIIAGDYFQAVTLKRAAPERARKVLILADRSAGPSGVMASATEVDARTIMTAMTLNEIARGVLVAAEVLDAKMDQYLKMASVNEIIYSREYNRLLLGNATAGTGISNILFDLLDPKTPTLITTHPVPEAFYDRGYAEFKAAYERSAPHCVVIGVLENTGNSHRIKEQALRQAQKTPDMGRLVQNLKLVKELKCNHPVFTPGEGYLVREGSMAIVIETRPPAGESSRGGKADVAGQKAS